MSYYNDDLEYASLLIQEGHKEEASRLVRDYLDKNPDDPDGWYLFAAAAPIPEYAVRHLQRALDIDPFHAKARAALPKVQAALERANAEPPPPPPIWQVALRRIVMIAIVLVIVAVAVWLLNMYQNNKAQEQIALATAQVIMTLAAQAPTASPVPLETLPPPALYEAPADPAAWVDLAGSAGEVSYQGGRLILTGTTPNALTSQYVAEQTLSDGVFTVTVNKISGPLNDGSGLALRVDPDRGDFYLFLVSSDGYAAAFYCEGWCGTGLTEIVPWTQSAAISQGVGAVNLVGVTADGADFQFAVNDSPVAGFSDDRRTEGAIGVGTFVFEPGPSTVSFEGLTVRMLP